MAVTSRLQAEPFDAAEELRRFSADRMDDGAVVSFTGLARGKAHSGDVVEKLVLDHYPGMTERSIEVIAEAAAGASRCPTCWSCTATARLRPAKRSCSWRPPRVTAAKPSPAPTI